MFAANGKQYLIVDSGGSICKFDFAKKRQIGKSLRAASELGRFAESLCYYSEKKAIALTENNRIILIDTARMKIEDELILSGHEPRPIGEYYPTLRKEEILMTDISQLIRVGDRIVFVFRRNWGTGLDRYKDSLIWVWASA